MRRLLFPIVLLCSIMAVADPIEGMMDFVRSLHGNPTIVEQTDDHMRVRMADSCYYDLYTPVEADTIVLIQTVCAPICSSCVRVYSKEWKALHNLLPTCGGIFPEAKFVDGHILWTDNTPLFLDEEENKKRVE